MKPIAVIVTALLLASCAGQPSVRESLVHGPVDIHLVALNDFHGNLAASKSAYGSAGSAGGIAAIGAALQAWRLEDPDLLLIGGGDLVGASPALSSMWADEPSIVALNQLGMQVSSVGNHEFDAGRIELLRQQHGGCASPRPDRACQLAPAYGGANFTYLAANVIDSATGQPFMPAYRIVQAGPVKIGFIGAVLKETASVVLASGVAGLDFIDEADAINRVLPQLRAQGVGVFVALIHEGGRTDEAFDQSDCARLTGPIVGIVQRLDPAIRLVVSGHTHRGYTCRVDGRMVTQAGAAGQLLSRIALRVDVDKNAVLDVSARNVVMSAGAHPADKAVDAYLETLTRRSAAALERPIARLELASVTRNSVASGESALGDLVADAQLAATRMLGARIAFMNNGGMRRDLDAHRALSAVAGGKPVTTYGQVQAVLPFGNTLVVMNLSGAQIRRLLEQQWPVVDVSHAVSDTGTDALERGVLQVSGGFGYAWDGKRPAGARVVPGSVQLDGKPLADADLYRVAVNNFLAEGGDKFAAFTAGSERIDSGIRDVDALQAHLVAQDKAGLPAGRAQPQERIVRVK